jgi:hypothetical protein
MRTVDSLSRGFGTSAAGEGENGTLFLTAKANGDPVAIFKPTIDPEEDTSDKHTVSFVPTGIDMATTAEREVAAYFLDEEGLYGVPATALANVTHPSFETSPRRGVLQEFVESTCQACEMGSRAFPVHEVQKIAILDLRLFNCDRHDGNILVQTSDDEGSYRLIPIDHGFSLPDRITGDIWFDWLSWPQSKQPILPELREHIERINIEQSAALLKGLHIRPESIRVMKVSTLLLKKFAAGGFSLNEIGHFICRKNQKDLSELETLFKQASETVMATHPDLSADSDQFDRAFFEVFGDLLDFEILKRHSSIRQPSPFPQQQRSQSSQSNPSRLVNSSSPVPRGTTPSPAPQLTNPSPVPRLTNPSPVPRSFQPLSNQPVSYSAATSTSTTTSSSSSLQSTRNSSSAPLSSLKIVSPTPLVIPVPSHSKVNFFSLSK